MGAGNVTAAELSSGGRTDSDFGGKRVGATAGEEGVGHVAAVAVAEEDVGNVVGAAVAEEDIGNVADAAVAEDVDDAADAVVGDDVQVDGSVDAAGVAGVDGGTAIPGGGDATASGSSISSNGKSGSCSSKGEIGTPAKPFGTAGLTGAPVVDGAAVDEPSAAGLATVKVACEPVVATVVATSSCGVCEKSVDGLTVPKDPETAVLAGALGKPAVAEAAVDELEAGESAAPVRVRNVPEVAAANPALPDPVLAEPRLGETAVPELAGEVPPTATPIGFIAFLVPVVAASFADVPGDGALRGAARAAPNAFEGVALLVGTPTGLEVPVEAGPDLLAPIWVADSVDAVLLDLPELVLEGAALAAAPAVEPPREAPEMALDTPANPSLLAPLAEAVPARAETPSRPVGPAEAVPTPAETASRPAAPAEAAPVPAGLEFRTAVLEDAAPETVAPLAAPAEFVPALTAPSRDVEPLPLVPSTRAGAPGSETPRSTSGSRSSADAMSVGTSAESGRAAGTTDPDAADGLGASGPRSSNAPWESKSSSESIGLFEVAAAADAEVDGGVAVEEVTPEGVPFPANPKGSSTGRSAKDSKAGREAASIVFEPESRRSILYLSCNASAEPPRRWLTDRRGRPDIVTYITLCRAKPSISALQKSDEPSSILPPDEVQGGESAYRVNPNRRPPTFEFQQTHLIEALPDHVHYWIPSARSAAACCRSPRPAGKLGAAQEKTVRPPCRRHCRWLPPCGRRNGD